jgi:hypothetical protein
MYYFQIPPSWPISPDFVPVYGWEPQRTFPAVPNDWEFWVLEDYDPTLPTAVHDDRGRFNNHPFEVAARRTELTFIESKKFVNEAIKAAYSDRKRREQIDWYARYAQTENEKYVEELIRNLVHLGGDVREARIKADREFELWRQSLINKPSELGTSASQQATHTPVSTPTPLPLKPQEKNPSRIKSPSHPVPTDSSTSQYQRLTPPPIPTYQKVLKYVGPSVTPSEDISKDQIAADSFWNYLIHKVNQLNSLTLSADKMELIAALEEAKAESEIYENIVKGREGITGSKSQIIAPETTNEKIIDRRDDSTSHRSQYIEREVEGHRERAEKVRFRKEVKAQKEKADKQQELALKEHIAKVKSEATRIAALEYEETHLMTALGKAEQIRAHNDDEKAENVIAGLKTQLDEIRKALKNSNTIANNRAGWVYVISNVGSFGEGIVKIGVTRNHDPYARIKELNSASVPFTFDVHALHFSTDAVGLEAALHRHFSLNKVNLINEKKEFFYTTPEEVKEIMHKLSDGALTKFNLKTPAAEWRKSEEIRDFRKNGFS